MVFFFPLATSSESNPAHICTSAKHPVKQECVLNSALHSAPCAMGSQHCSVLLAAARSQNGSGVINTIHYRSAASLPVGSSSDGANSRTMIDDFLYF